MAKYLIGITEVGDVSVSLNREQKPRGGELK